MTAPDRASERRSPAPAGRLAWVLWWLPGLVVALGAAVATAHGLYEVAVAAQVPAAIAWLYPLITDGLALVAYTATARLVGRAARYAWVVVILAAGLSGLAQAVYLAGGAALDAPPTLRFGIGAWPAIAAAVVAHLLYLLAPEPDTASPQREHGDQGASEAVERSPEPVHPAAVPPVPYDVQPVQPDAYEPTAESPCDYPEPDGPSDPAADAERPSGPGARTAGHAPAPASERARDVALRLAHSTGSWPTVTAVETEAEVGRGTAAAVLKTLRDQPPGLHLITSAKTPTDQDRTQP